MIISEFVLTGIIQHGKVGEMLFADVSVTTETGWLWWKEKNCVRRKIAREYGCFWYFVDNGIFIPGNQVEALERGYRAREAMS